VIVIRCDRCDDVVYANLTEEPYDDDEVQTKIDAHDRTKHG
jgi:hypothetical protein